MSPAPHPPHTPHTHPAAHSPAPTTNPNTLPSRPPRRAQPGFLILPPFRVQGISIAGEQSAVEVPELDLCFDLGVCTRSTLACKYVALTHGHMDHAAQIAYYYSQRHFQGMDGGKDDKSKSKTGTICCPEKLAGPIQRLMGAWVDIEAQHTPFAVIPMTFDPNGNSNEIEIKPKHFLRAFQTDHRVPSCGYVVVEKRTKLKPELQGMPQERIVDLKKKGEEVTYSFEVPQVCYTGDTQWCSAFDRDDVLNAKILITECTFTEPGHRRRAAVGKHMHLDNIVTLVERSKAHAIVLTHLSRRTNINLARKQIDDALPPEHRDRVFILMDGRSNRDRYERQERGEV